MITPPLARRRADAFDAAVERGAVEAGSAGTTELLGLVADLRALAAADSAPAARPAFVGDLRERLVLAAATELRPVEPAAPRSRVAPPPVRSRRERGLAVAVGALAIAGATTSMAVAAQSALPGEVLYPVKRALESADARLSAEDQRGPELLAHASSRLSEVDALARRDQGRPVDAAQERVLTDTLDTFADQASAASDALLERYQSTGDPQSVTALKDFAGDSLDQLVTLEDTLPDAVRPAVLDAAQALFVIDQAADAACAECVGLGISEIPPTLVAATTTLAELAEGAANIVVPQAVAPSAGSEPADPGSPAKPTSPTTAADPTPTADPTQPTQAPTPRPSQPAVPTTRADGVLPSTGATKKKVESSTDTLLGDLLRGSSTASADPSAPTLGEVLGDAVDGTLEGVDGLTGGLTGSLTDPLLKPRP